MAKDDYFVIAYYLLKYLYSCLKQGIVPSENIIRLEDYICDVSEEYWIYVIANLQEDGYIRGASIAEIPILGKRKQRLVKSIVNIEITPKGIEHLHENSTLNKAYDALKQFKDIIPFI